jgi:glycosyltransferase involved in cell wall biosynthesis
MAGHQAMNLSSISGLPKKVYRSLSSYWTKDIYYVTDSSDWILKWVGYYVTTNLKESTNVSVHLTNDLKGLRNQIIHFISRYAYLNGTFRHLHPSNHIFLTWFHGGYADLNPKVYHLYTVLNEAVESVSKIVVSCKISRQDLITFGIPECKLATIPLGIDLSRFSPPTKESRLNIRAKLGISEDTICLGSFQKDGKDWGDGNEPKLIKGPDVFLEVISNLSNRYPNIVVLLTGPSRGYIKQGLERLGVRYIHHFLSNYHDIVPYYQALDLYIIASRCEGGPAALLESWATGVPVISTRVGMPADLIRHGKNGMLSEVKDVEGLTENAMDLIEDNALREICRSQALRDAKQYDWPVISERYYELYQPFLR